MQRGEGKGKKEGEGVIASYDTIPPPDDLPAVGSSALTTPPPRLQAPSSARLQALAQAIGFISACAWSFQDFLFFFEPRNTTAAI